MGRVEEISNYLFALLYIPSSYIPSHIQTSPGFEGDLKQYSRLFSGNLKNDNICISIVLDLEGGQVTEALGCLP